MVGFYHLFVLFLISNKISFAPEETTQNYSVRAFCSKIKQICD